MTPTGSEMRRAGTPITNRMKPLMFDFAPSSSASHTNANRCVLCTKMNIKLLSHKRLKARIRNSSVGRMPCSVFMFDSYRLGWRQKAPILVCLECRLLKNVNTACRAKANDVRQADFCALNLSRSCFATKVMTDFPDIGNAGSCDGVTL